jgi:hypothetical protein
MGRSNSSVSIGLTVRQEIALLVIGTVILAGFIAWTLFK